MASVPQTVSRGDFDEKEKEKDVRTSNIVAARAVADAIRTSLGPKGMDKMISSPNGEVIISNDGATILKHLEVRHPAGKMLAELAKAQDIEAGDGTTSVCVIAGALLSAVSQLMSKGIHPSIISEAFNLAMNKSIEVLTNMSTPISLSDKQSLVKSAITSLNSKVVSQYTNLATIAVDAVLDVINPATATNVNLKDIKIIKKLGGTIDETELVHGLVFDQHTAHGAGGPTRIQNAKIGLIQFCLSAPKTYMDNNIVVSDYTKMDKVLKEEPKLILEMCRKIQKSGCNVLLVQKSILRDALNEYSLHYLAKLKILVVKDIEREDIEFICNTVGCTPIANIDSFTPEKLGKADLVEEVGTTDGKIVKITGIPNPGKTVTILARGSNKLVLDEAERSIHDALCVIRSLVKKKFLIAGGGAPEIEVSQQVTEFSKTLLGNQAYCVRAYAEALEIIPYTLAENAGLHPISIVTELRNKHAQGEKTAGINVRKGAITNILQENVVQPLLVSTSALTLATETVIMLLKIDDIVTAR
ncbi:chaperonin containing TCP1 delta subunit [Heterostelium album PN500]|uniref:T-complex protein 1 subunit delta n=1 Tax=Heterostelium pallidum (strain ATCC 26659 / Pp 5 / PN500) TaxID=670386 RepID=D3B3N8_HETP5|nr:chaperonin containing TCP1 delta subunit [Heterostelium album PN500]EFA83936.1 chaperonin containing TCP1 delta subunit [Heterostelium album PN500]|eukprot:XP_020436053.1 chaperonin containing TCP1 delta subunit [Heterostelium album PN500]